jgi:acetyl esterase/lipase
MKKSLLLTLVVAMAAYLAPGMRLDVAKAGLVDDANPSAEDACKDVSLSRGLKYGESEQNLVDVATMGSKDSTPRPVLLFVAGENFTNEGTASDWTLRDQAMCLAAKNGLVGVAMAYRRAPQFPWPAGAKDVAAATSWIHQNIDLFGGDRRQLIAVGYSVGAFHLATFLAHREFQDSDSGIAAAVLVSGLYQADTDTGDGGRAYFGADASKYQDRSALPGLLEVESPIVLAWSAADPPRMIAQAEMLRQQLCKAGHCPRVAELTDPDTPASVFDLDGAGKSLAERTKQLIDQIEMRGLP